MNSSKVTASITRPTPQEKPEAEVLLTMPESQAKFIMGLVAHVRLTTPAGDKALAVYRALRETGVEPQWLTLEAYTGPFAGTNRYGDNTKLDITAKSGALVAREVL